VPEGVTRIGKFAFEGSKLTSIVIPASVTDVEESAFSGSALTRAKMPDALLAKADSFGLSAGLAATLKAEAPNDPLASAPATAAEEQQSIPSLTVGDVTYENVRLKKEYPSSLFIQHSGGTAFIEKAKLSGDQIASVIARE